MAFDPVAFLDLANELLRGLSGRPTARSDLDRAKVRASISRSYYCVYLVAREKLYSLGIMIPAGRPIDHTTVISAITSLNTELGKPLSRFREKRNRADYNLNPSGFTLAAGQYWLNTARELVRQINSLK
jgi:uncharacterized protein (UPF0332 family)